MTYICPSRETSNIIRFLAFLFSETNGIIGSRGVIFPFIIPKLYEKVETKYFEFVIISVDGM